MYPRVGDEFVYMKTNYVRILPICLCLFGQITDRQGGQVGEVHILHLQREDPLRGLLTLARRMHEIGLDLDHHPTITLLTTLTHPSVLQGILTTRARSQKTA